MRTLHHPSTHDIQLTSVFYSLSDPVRLQMVASLAGCEEQTCGSFGVDLPKSTLSHHFKVLREAGVVRVRVEGTHRFVSLRRDDLEMRFPGLLDRILEASSSVPVAK